jgi:hypothetical protein
MTDPANQNSDTRLVTLVRGVMERGGFYWCYLAVKPELMPKFQEAVANKYNIQRFVKDGYGEVVVSGTGREPPKDVTAKVSQMFGITFEELEEGNAGIGIAQILARSQNKTE